MANTHSFGSNVRVLRRKCACGGETHAGGECAECRQKRQRGLQRAAVRSHGANSVPAVVHDVLREQGAPLTRQAREFMEPRFGHDFSGVRVHTSARAAESARAVDALAYTVGNRVVFGAGQLNTATTTGWHLLAHELAHVVQQSSGPALSAPLHIDSDASAEYDANRAADTALRSAPAPRANARHASAELSPTDAQFTKQPLRRNGVLQRQESALDRDFQSAAAKRARDFRPRFRPHIPRAPTTHLAPGPRTARRGGSCLSGPQCQLAIPGSATDFSAGVDVAQETRQREIQTNPAVRAAAGSVRQATEITAFATREAPGILAGITAIMVNPAIGDSAGAQVGECRLMTPRPRDPNVVCIEVPDALEREAGTYNNKPDATQIGSKDRDHWRVRALEMLIHETAHVRFERGASAGITMRDATSFSELNELFALLSELPLFFREARREQPTPEKQEERSRGVMRKMINKQGEGIRGVLTKLRCLHPCDVVDRNVRTVFTAVTASWSREEVRLALSELTDPANHLAWPVVPLPSVAAPGPPPRPRQGPLYQPRGGFYDTLGRTEEDL